MLLTAQENEMLQAWLFADMERLREAFGYGSKTARLIERVLAALRRGEVVQARNWSSR